VAFWRVRAWPTKGEEYPTRPLSWRPAAAVAIIPRAGVQAQVMLLDEGHLGLEPPNSSHGGPRHRQGNSRRTGMTMVLATHEMAFRPLTTRTDTVCFLDDGVLLERGSPEQIFTDPGECRGLVSSIQRIIKLLGSVFSNLRNAPAD
jgi:polar amino acid transport system ATP-binding protein